MFTCIVRFTNNTFPEAVATFPTLHECEVYAYTWVRLYSGTMTVSVDEAFVNDEVSVCIVGTPAVSA